MNDFAENAEQNAETFANEATKGAQELQETAVSAFRNLVELQVQTTERAAATFADLWVQAAGASKVDAVKEAASTQADLIRRVSELYASTTRELIAQR